MVYLRSIQINNGAAEPLPETTTSNPLPSSIVRLGGGLFGIVCGGKFVIDSSLNIASQLGLSEAFIALFGIALGTSLPELITGIVALKEKKDLYLLDVRNNYEINLGTFKNANYLNIQSFTEFPEASKTLPKDREIVMFCTGGIRCEKAYKYLKSQNFNAVRQLQGGIINYLNKIINITS